MRLSAEVAVLVGEFRVDNKSNYIRSNNCCSVKNNINNDSSGSKSNNKGSRIRDSTHVVEATVN